MLNKFIFITLLLVSLLTSCTVEKMYLQDKTREGQAIDVKLDTLVKTYSVKGQKIYEVVRLNNNTLKTIDYGKDGSRTEIHLKTRGIEYYKNGQIKITTTLKNGRRDGNYFTFYENGNRQCVCNYSEGNREGQQAIYFENGQMYSHEEYRNGVLWNIFKRFDEKGNPLDIGAFKDGNGYVKNYDDNGNLEETIYYKLGEITKKVKAKKAS